MTSFSKASLGQPAVVASANESANVLKLEA
jgi:hypothetical protein